MIPFENNSRKGMVMSSDRTQVSSCLGIGQGVVVGKSEEGGITKEYEGTSGGYESV